MAELRRSIKCSNCGSETTIYLASEMVLSEVLLHGRCNKCGNSLQLNYSLIDQNAPKQPTVLQSSAESSPLPNLDQTLFEPELPSESIKDLIED